MNNNNEWMDDKIKEYAKKQEVILSEKYINMIHDKIEIGSNLKAKPHFVLPRTAVAVLILAVITVGAGGVYAAKNFIAERMGQMSEEEKNDYMSDLTESAMNADQYSRDFTQDEKNRINNLTKQYKAEGRFPKKSVLKIDTENQIDNSRICFLGESSKFYLPDTLSDEDILELIDFYYKRDYSLTNSGTEKEDVPVEEIISKKDAIELVKQKVEDVFSVNLQEALISSEYNKGYAKENFSESFVTVSFEDIEYIGTVDMQTGEITELSVTYKKPNYSENQLIDETSFENKYTTIKEIFEKFAPEKKIDRVEMEYVSNGNKLEKGVFNYIFYSNDVVYVVGYSCENDAIYDIRCFSKEVYQNLCRKKERRYKEHGIDRTIKELQ